MEHVVIFIYLGIAIVMVIVDIFIGRRRSNSHLNHDTTNGSNFDDFGSDNTASDRHLGHADQSTSSDSPHRD